MPQHRQHFRRCINTTGPTPTTVTDPANVRCQPEADTVVPTFALAESDREGRESGRSLRPQTKIGSSNKAEARSHAPVLFRATAAKVEREVSTDELHCLSCRASSGQVPAAKCIQGRGHEFALAELHLAGRELISWRRSSGSLQGPPPWV